MNIFEEIKSQVSTRQMVEMYGLKVNRKGMACCPFHKDKHPSMKIDASHYHCFGCGAHGDAVGYVAQLYGMSQYDAACKIVEDMHLSIETNYQITESDKQAYKRQQEQRNYADAVKKKYNRWIMETINQLKECEELIQQAKESFIGKNPGVVFLSNGLAYLLIQQEKVSYWLDILCIGSEEEQKQLFLTDGKEVRRIAANIKRTGNEILGRNQQCAG